MVDSTTSNVNSNTDSNQVGNEGVGESQPPNQAAAAGVGSTETTMVDSTTSNVNSNTEFNQVGDEGVRETQPPNQAAAATEAAAEAAAAEAAAAEAAAAEAAAAEAAAAEAAAAEAAAAEAAAAEAAAAEAAAAEAAAAEAAAAEAAAAEAAAAEAAAAEAAAAEAAAAAAEEKEILKMKKTMKSHMIVAALIATVTFGAGFTLPGGYIQNESNDQGMAVLSLPTNGNKGNDRLMEIALRKSFRVFVVADSIAMILSMCAVGIYFFASLPFKNKSTIRFLVLYGYYLTLLAMAAMVGAFVAGLKAVLYHSSFFEGATGFILVAFFFLFAVPAFVLLVVSVGNFGY